MRLDRVTITGIDDAVEYQTIKRLTDRFPFVEWGVLMSKSRKGSPRYPSLGWLAGLVEFFTGPDCERTYQSHFSAHVCGEICTYLVQERGSMLMQRDYLGGPALLQIFGRVQLNGYPDQLYTPYRVNAMDEQVRRDAHIILPVSSEKVQIHAMSGMRSGLQFLYDQSRGRGLAPEGWPYPKLKGYTGYAGGITPDNIRDTLTELTSRESLAECFWIDLESGARTGEEFDMHKVESILNTAGEFIHA